MTLTNDTAAKQRDTSIPARFIRCIPVDDHELVCVVPAVTALDIIVDAVQLESGRNLNVVMQEIATMREEVQREIAGTKKRNSGDFTEYVDAALRKEQKNWVLPPVTAWTPEALEVLPEEQAMIPDGTKLIAIDGETQTIAWRNVLDRMSAKERREIATYPVKLIIHHGKDVEWAGQAFHDLNILGVRPNVTVGISMDRNDSATRITNAVVEELGIPVNRMKRQLPASEKTDLFTLSAFRTAILTTAFGMAGIAYGSRSVGDRIEPHQEQEYRSRITRIWQELYAQLLPHFTNRREEVASAPATLAALGAVAHLAFDETMEVDEILELLSDVDWRKQNDAGEFIWDGILGKVSVRETETLAGLEQVRRFAIGGPKEVSYQTYDALANARGAAGRRIRGRN